MATRMRDAISGRLDELRYEPTEKRVRALLAGDEVVDSTRVLLVWEPKRVVPSYAVAIEDVRGELVPAATSGPAGAWQPPMLHPGIAFAEHSTDGEGFDLRTARAMREGVAFAPADPDLAGHVILDHHGFDAWLEEDEPILGHPRDPFHRVDMRRSSRHVRIERNGALLADSSRATLLFETGLPTRFYLPREDVLADLRPTVRQTYCPYKGQASYWSVDVAGRPHPDLAWSYEDPLQDARALAGLVAFYDERVDVVLDGERRARPRTAVSKAIMDEVGITGEA
ncbi:MAG: DUF427 domain-containing protein [Solirubrobacteraceae bacterium]